MKRVHAAAALLLALWAAGVPAAERAIYTLVDGDVRVLRKTTWYRLEPGARIESGDVLDVAERAQLQLEPTGATVIGIIGPAFGYVEDAGSAAKTAPAAQFTLLRGWLKAANGAKAPPVRIELPSSALRVDNGIVVVHCDAMHTEFFVESGRATLMTAAAGGRGKEQAREAGEGEYWHKAGDHAFATDERLSQAFVAAMPVTLRDALPTLASRFGAAPPTLAAGRDVTYAEAEPLLAGAGRRAFARRFAPRLSDPAFRTAAAAARPGVAEWDRTLHPERYRPRDADEKAASTPATARP